MPSINDVVVSYLGNGGHSINDLIHNAYSLGPITATFTIQAAALRTLNSLPVTLVTPPTATSIVVPRFVYQFVKPGGVAFSAPLAPVLSVDSTGSAFNAVLPQNISGTDSVAATFDVGDDVSGVDYVFGAGVGVALYLTHGADVTGGDGTVLTLMLTYQIVETDGLI